MNNFKAIIAIKPLSKEAFEETYISFTLYQFYTVATKYQTPCKSTYLSLMDMFPEHSSHDLHLEVNDAAIPALHGVVFSSRLLRPLPTGILVEPVECQHLMELTVIVIAVKGRISCNMISLELIISYQHYWEFAVKELWGSCLIWSSLGQDLGLHGHFRMTLSSYISPV